MPSSAARLLNVAFLGGVLFCPLPVAAQSLADLPARKPGHWEIKIVTEKPAGTPVIESGVCLDTATDRDLMEFGLRMSKDVCKRFDMKKSGATLVIDSECSFGPVESTTRTTMTGDFQTSYTIRIEGKSSGMPMGGSKEPQDLVMLQNARWTGAACPNGMKPGDFTLPGGMRMNIKQAKKLQKMLPNVQIR